MIALNAKTGQRIASFGVNGAVDMKQGFAFDVQTAAYGNPPLIVRDVIVLGGTASAPGRLVPGNIRGTACTTLRPKRCRRSMREILPRSQSLAKASTAPAKTVTGSTGTRPAKHHRKYP